MTMQEQSKPAIGFIGMGHMGSHMAPRLINAGYHLTVYDRTGEKAQGIAGASVAETPEEAAAHSNVVISIVTNDLALEEVMFGPNGVLAGMHAGSVIIDMSTVSPRSSRHLYQAAREKNVAMIEADEISVSMPATAVALQMYTAALAKGMDEDFSIMIKFMEQLAGVSV